MKVTSDPLERAGQTPGFPASRTSPQRTHAESPRPDNRGVSSEHAGLFFPEEDLEQQPESWPAPREESAGAAAYGASHASTWRDRIVLQTLRLMLRHRLVCVFLIGTAAIAGGLMTLRLPRFYIAHATIFPSADSNPLASLGLAGASGLMGDLGLTNSGNSEFPLYENVLYSRRLIAHLLTLKLEALDDGRTLLDYLQISEPDLPVRTELAVDAIRARFSYDVDKKTGLVTIGFRDGDPRLAAEVVNGAVGLLDRFDVSTTTTRAGERRKFVEARLAEVSRSLAEAERRVEEFQQQNLRISNAPELLLEQARLQRELDIQQQVYLTLRREAELARIEEQRTLPVVNVLDDATPPTRAAGPSLVRNAALAGILGTILVICVFLLRAIGFRTAIEGLGVLRPAR